jgi:acyl-CoA thioester hydrolase
MNNAVYQHLFDSIINEYLISHCGQSLHTTKDTKDRDGEQDCIGLIVQTSISYLAPVVFPEVVRLGVRVLAGAEGLRQGGSSVTYECVVFGDERDEKPRAVGRMTHVFVEREGRRPMEGGMPMRIREGLRKLQVGVSGESEVRGGVRAKM